VAAKKPAKKPAKPAAKKAKPAARPAKKPAAKAVRKPAPKKVVAKKPAAKPAAKKVPVKKATPAAKKMAAKPPVVKSAVAKGAIAKKPAAVPVKGRASAPVVAKKVKVAASPVAAAAKKGKTEAAPVAPPRPQAPSPKPLVRPQGARAQAVVRKDLPEKIIPLQAVPSHVTLPKGYRPTTKEQYMSPFQMEYFRQRLHGWRTELVEESKQTIENLKEEVRDVGDEAERATRETENSLELRTRDRYRKLIGKIDDALKRIDDGVYGYCVDTGDEIGLERLEARLTAERTIDAQERWEHRQKQMGD
jgi:DnaK suppressor protein